MLLDLVSVVLWHALAMPSRNRRRHCLGPVGLLHLLTLLMLLLVLLLLLLL